jgi:UDP-N-acetylmuramate: L-alanyl-gamma-D-glutamyl-meso-diaminopimelate ligase
VILGAVARLDQIPEAERLDPHRVVADLVAMGKKAAYEPDTTRIVERICGMAKPGDVVVVFSNGGFDGLHRKLLEALA